MPLTLHGNVTASRSPRPSCPLPSGSDGHKKAEATRGGVNVKELDPKTMQSRLCAGLYFIGEVTDITGWLGGYNFQWAWSSAVCAAEAVA